MTARWAIYWAPPEQSPLEHMAAQWLGRDLAGSPVPRVAGTGLDLPAITAEPAFYGFHATLKPPFALAEGRDAADLVRAARLFCTGRRPFTLPPLMVAQLGSFLALVPRAPCPAVNALAAEAVQAFDLFRAPQSAAELAKRRAKGLSPRQESYLQTWGYPYVLDEFRFHLTLTGPLADPRPASAILDPWLAPALEAPQMITEIALYRQESRQAPFVLAQRLPFGA